MTRFTGSSRGRFLPHSSAHRCRSTRRAFLDQIAACSIAAVLTGVPRPGSTGEGDEERVSQLDGDKMDEALEMLSPYAATFRRGLSNHGPMTAEALISLGCPEAVVPWIESYRKRLEMRPAARRTIDPEGWRAALGKRALNREWENWFGHQLEEAPWQEVVARWVPRLAPGIAAAALHGVIRVGHAVCSLSAKETPRRRDELARALAHWAAEYLPLPGAVTQPGKLAPSSALAKVPLLPNERRVGRGLITTAMKDLVPYEPFSGVIDLVDPKAGSPTFMSDLLATFAGVFVNCRSDGFTFLHAVTGSAAVAELLPLLPEKERPAVQHFTWQATAGIYARYAHPGLTASVKRPSPPVDLRNLVKGAGASDDAHTIKLASACRRAWQRNPDFRLLSAAQKRLKSHG